MNISILNLPFCEVDAGRVNGQIVGTSLLYVSTAGREAGSSESAFAFKKGAPRLK